MPAPDQVRGVSSQSDLTGPRVGKGDGFETITAVPVSDGVKGLEADTPGVLHVPTAEPLG